MHKLGYILFILGFVWVIFIAAEANAVARAMTIHHGEDVLRAYHENQSYTLADVDAAYMEAAYSGCQLTWLSVPGGLLMLVGGIILDKSSRRDLAPKPPVL